MGQGVIVFGAYDVGKPRVRLLIDALKKSDRLEAEIHVSVWQGVADKSVAGLAQFVGAAFRYLLGMPRALWRLSRHSGTAPLLLPYPGTPEIFLAGPIARARGRKVVLDAFLPIHDTIIRDRQMARENGIVARFLRWFEEAGLRQADVILVDTDAHGDFLSREYAIPRQRFETIVVGAEALFHQPPEPDDFEDILDPNETTPIILFYGQFIPLHGLATILEAAKLTRSEALRWIVVGSGQQEDLARKFVAENGSGRLTWVPWVDYRRLPALVARADICLGIFGGSDKAARVIPNKLFQALAMGKRVLTRSSPALDPLAEGFAERIVTIPPENAAALAEAVCDLVGRREPANASLPIELADILTPEAGVSRLITRLARE